MRRKTYYIIKTINAIAWCVIVAIFVGILVSLSSCRTITKIEEKIVYKDSIKIEKEYLRDSIYTCDSIFIKKKGDTIYFEKYKIVYKDRYLNKTDTIYLTKIETEKETETIEKKVVPKWCWWLLVFVGCFCCYKVIKKI